MAKITELSALADLEKNDLIHVVDVSDPDMANSGTNKKVTIESLANSLIAQELVGRPISEGGGAGQYYRGDGTWANLDAAAVQLGNVTNESKETMFTSPTFTGTPRSGNTTTNSLNSGALWLNGGSGALLFDSTGHKRIGWNDGAHFNIRAGNYYNGTNDVYAVEGANANAGAAKITLTCDGSAVDGAIDFRVAPSGVAGAAITYSNHVSIAKDRFTVNGTGVNVGIGTTSPGAKLNVVDSSANDAVRITQTGSGKALVVEDSTNPDSTQFVVDANGDVSIGSSETSTFQKLCIVSASEATPAQGGLGGIRIASSSLTSSGETGISGYLSDPSGVLRHSASISFKKDGEWVTGSSYPGNIGFWTRSNANAQQEERMRITSAGSVGIGTTAPGAKLNVVEANTSSATDAVRITNTGNGNSLVVEDSANPDSSPFVVTSSGRVLIGDTTNKNYYLPGYTTNYSVGIQGVGTTYQDGGSTLALSQWSTNTSAAGGAAISLNKSNAAPGTHAIVNNNQRIGSIGWAGSNGTTFNGVAEIHAEVDFPAVTVNIGSLVIGQRYKISKVGTTTTAAHWAAVGVTDTPSTSSIFVATAEGTAGDGQVTTEPMTGDLRIPGRLSFYTTADGTTAATPTERMRIDHRGNVRIGGGTPWSNVALQVVNTAGHSSSTTATGLQVSQSLPTYITGDYHAFVASPSTAENTNIQTGTINGFVATANTAGAGSRAKTAVGFHASGNLVRNPSENIFGFYSNIGFASLRIGDVARVAGVSTITTVNSSDVLTAHGFVPGQLIAIAATDTSFNGTFMVQSVPTNSSFTYTQTGAPNVTASGTLNNKGSATRTNNWNFYANGSSPNYFAGRTLFSGTTEFTTRIFGSNVTPRVQVLHNGNDAGYLAARFTNDGGSARLSFAKSRGAIGAHALVNAGDQLGLITFGGSDGTQIVEGAQIRSDVDSGVTVNATAVVAGKRYKIATPGNTVWTALGSANNNANTIFVATADGTSESGTGTATTEPNLNDMPTRMIFATTFSNTLNERMRIDSAGNVGIGTTAPTSPLVINTGTGGNSAFLGGAGTLSFGNGSNLATSVPSIVGHSSAGQGLRLCARTVDNNTSGDVNFDVRQSNGGNFTTTTNTAFRFSINGSSNVNILRNGNFGIGTNAPSYQLELSTDSAAKPTTSVWTISSDERLKENIEAADLDICYDAVKSIPLKRYKWKDEVYSPEQIADRSKIGWIAQDVQAVFPKAVGQHRFAYNQVKDEDGNIISEDVIEDCLSLNADQLYATMYGAIQKLMNTVETLQARIDQLESSS